MYRTSRAVTSLRAVRTPLCIRAFTTTPIVARSPLETVKDAAKKVDRTVSNVAVKGIETGEKVVGSVKETLPDNSQEAKGEAKEAYGQAKGEINELAGQAKGKANELGGNANELAGEAKGKAHEVGGQATGKKEELKGEAKGKVNQM
jgi:uncharacterized protein YjbJ (UPF0337 family)